MYAPTTSLEELEPLRPFQARGVKIGVRLRRAPIQSGTGSGKTRMALEIYRALELWRKAEPVVVVCRINAQLAWFLQIQQWLGIPPEAIGICKGQKKERTKVWNNRRDYRFILVTYSSFVTDTKSGLIPKDMDVFFDEVHRYLRNRNKMWEAICSATLHSDVLLPMSATLIKRGPQDLFPVLHLCAPKDFSGYWKYVKTWCHIHEGFFGQEILGPKNVANFKEEILAKHTIWITTKEIAKYMPKGQRILVPLEPTDEQKRLIAQIQEEMQLELPDDRLLLTQFEMTRITRMRQILCCPKIINPEWGYGACVEEIGERLQEIESPRPVIFTPFVEGIPYIKEYVQGIIKDHRQVHTLQGGLDLADLHNRVRAFNTSEDDVLICSLLYAESFEFPISSVAFFCAYDWDWTNNVQAEGRLLRLISQDRNPRFFYPVHYGYIDERVMQVLTADTQNTRRVSPQDLREMFRKLRTKEDK